MSQSTGFMSQIIGEYILAYNHYFILVTEKLSRLSGRPNYPMSLTSGVYCCMVRYFVGILFRSEKNFRNPHPRRILRLGHNTAFTREIR